MAQMRLTRAENNLVAREMLQFDGYGIAFTHSASGKLVKIEANWQNINRQYFSAAFVDDDLNKTIICTRATISTILGKLKQM